MAKHNSDKNCIVRWGVCDMQSNVDEGEIKHVCSEPIPHDMHICMVCDTPQARG